MAHAKTNTLTTADRIKHVHGIVRHHYDRHMPSKKHHRLLLWAVVCVLAAVITAQLLYPQDRALPLVRLQGQMVGFQKEDEIAFRINEQFESMNATLTSGDGKETTVAVREMGGEVGASDATHELTRYPLWQRLIPFSALFHWQDIVTVEIGYEQTVLRAFSEQLADDMSTPASNARLSIEDGVLVAVDEASGRAFDAAVVYETIALHNMRLGESTTIELPSQTVSPQTTAADLTEVRHEARQALARTIVITADDQTFTPSDDERISWVQLAQDDDENIVLAFDAVKAKAYLESVNASVGRAAGVTTIHRVDGREDRRDTGDPGRRVDYDALLGGLESWVIRGEGTGEQTAAFVSLAPTTRTQNQYTSSQAGLQAYVGDAAQQQNATIVVQQTNGNGWRAAAGETRSMPSASTYKLYVAWVLFTKIDQGSIKWSDSMLDTTVSGCFDRMTIASTNPCAEQWLADFGRTNMNNFLYSRGYSRGTSFTHPVAAHTTANDLAKFMVALERGENISGGNKDRLLRSLSTHPYRQGVPAGSGGRVWDKVGFLWDYVHDAAIVHHPKGKYVIVVMTKGRSYQTIADITRQVERIMYP